MLHKTCLFSKVQFMGIILKEILPMYRIYIYMTLHISELPPNVFSKVVAFKLGDPRYMRLKYSRALRRIQVMYEIFSFDPVIEMDEDNDVYAFEIR